MDYKDQEYMMMAIAASRKAREHGNHPFGAVLVGPDQQHLLDAENTVESDRDITAHAELNLVRKASQAYTPTFLEACTLYTSTEPCPMCAGAIFWSGIRRVVFGLAEYNLYEIIGEDTTDAVLRIPCRDVFARGKRQIEVIGPLLEEEAREVHLGFWNSA